MFPQSAQPFQRTDIWREGKWIDLWSVVHFLSGMSIGFGFVIVHLGTAASIIIVLLLLIGYEMWETIVKIEETPQNRIMDVVVGFASFIPTFIYAQQLDSMQFIVAGAITIGINVFLATLGWLASRKADALEKRMKLRYEHQRERIILRSRQWRAELARRRRERVEARHIHNDSV